MWLRRSRRVGFSFERFQVLDKQVKIIFSPLFRAPSDSAKHNLSAAFRGEVHSSYNFRDLVEIAIAAPRFKRQPRLFFRR
jgi:hypothetical protein